LAADEFAAEPLTWGQFLRWTSRRRETMVMSATWRLLAEDAGARLSLPFWDLGFLASMAHAGGRTGLGGRTSAMRTVFSDILPDAILSRWTKAGFTTAYWSGHSRVFARQWDGTGVDPTLVDSERLRAVWCSELPTYGSATLLHAAWLASELGEGR
jgi:asparagine synthase (glutamine-hydrolysing)